MSTTMTVPVTIAPDAFEFVERLGQRQEFERMIDRAEACRAGSCVDRGRARRCDR